MNLLLDTNIFIPLEPASREDVEPNAELAASLLRLAQTGGHVAFLHPAWRIDIDRDTDRVRAQLRQTLAGKYPELPDPPTVSPQLRAVLGRPEIGSNDWVDDQLLAALEADAVHLLVSEDRAVRRKARRLGLGERVLLLDEAVRILGGSAASSPPPAVVAVKAHALSRDDPILDSFREDYDRFDDWFARCRQEQRQAWKIDGTNGRLAGFCIVKPESGDADEGVGRSPLKLCSFKVSPDFNGHKYGELLLRTVFGYAREAGHTGAYVTVFEKHAGLVDLLEDFGFERGDCLTDLGELVLSKRLVPEDGVSGLDLHIKYGPPIFDPQRPWYVVPIQPRYSDVLFPETAEQASLFEGRLAFGNAIRKAYLCHSACRQIQSGDVLAFYRTQHRQALISLGVVEDTLVSSDPDLVARAVARRSVYSSAEIKALCGRREVLAIRFRLARLITPPRPSSELVSEGVITRAPQSIMRVRPEGASWLVDQLAA